MDNIIYEEETVKEEVFEGDLILDGHQSEEEQRASIFQMMRDAGISVEKEEEYSIGYEGASDDDGISETQTSHFVVTRTYQKQVPYRVNREELYSGEWILDGIRMTPEEQRQKILAEARASGVDVSDEENIEIGYEGVEDEDGISETQKTRYVIYHVTKERVDEQEVSKEVTPEEDENAKLARIREELIALREKVRASTDPSEIAALSDRMVEVSDLLENLVNESTRDYEPFTEALAEIEEEIHRIQDRIIENMREYLESYERIQKIMGVQTDTFHSSLTPEELDKKIQELAKEKLTEDDDSLAARNEIDKQIAELKELVAKRNKIRKDFEAAQALGISALEYRELTDNFKSRKLVNAILEKKGLGELLQIPAKERTKEQKARIKAVREEIFAEIAAAKKENEEKSVLDLVEALYGISAQVQLKGKQRVLIVKPSALENMKKNVTKFPEKIVNEAKDDPITYTPGATPKDMEEVMERRAQETQEDKPLEKFTIFMNDGKLYAREPVFERFDLDPIGEEVRIEGTLCHEIDPDDVVRMEANSNNDFSPYEIEYRQAEVVKRDVVEQQPEVETTNAKEEEKSEEKVLEKFTFFVNEGKIYARVPVFERFDKDPIGPEVRIEGTLCQEIRPDDATDIVANQNNSYSPYQVEYREAEVLKEYEGIPQRDEEDEKDEKEQPVEEPVEEEKQEETVDVAQPEKPIEKFTLFMNGGKLYVREPVFTRFNIEPVGEEVRIEGTKCYEIQPNDARAIVMNANNNYSPYLVDAREAEVVREQVEEPPIVEEDQEEWEELFRGELIIGEEDIYDVILRDHGLDIRGDDSYYVGYEGASDNDGISETQTTEYVVFRRKEKEKEEVVQPPVEEEKDEWDELFSGELIVGEEDIYDVILRDHGIDIRGDDSYYVGYEGVTDNDGISETQTTRYVVFKKREKVKVKEIDEVEKPPVVDETEDEKDKAPVVNETEDEKDKNPVVEEPQSEKEELPKVLEKFTFFTKDGKIYARGPVFERFDIDPIGDAVRIEGTICYEIHPSDVREIATNAGNDYSPYDVEYRETAEVIPQVREQPTEVFGNERGADGQVLERFTFFTKDGKVYARNPVFDRFNVDPIGDEIRIDGTICHEILASAAAEIAANANNDYSPYVVEYRDADYQAQEAAVPEEVVEEDITPEEPIDTPVEEPQEEVEEENNVTPEPVSEEQQAEGTEDSSDEGTDDGAGVPEDVQEKTPEIPQQAIETQEQEAEEEEEEEKEEENIPEATPVQEAHEVEETPLDTAHEVGEQEREVGTRTIPLAEQITLFMYDGKMYARKPVFDRFNIEPVGEEVRIENTACYEVRPEDVYRIEMGADNEYSPYFIQYRGADDVVASEKEDLGDDIRPEDESDEYIPGTNFKKPRTRGVHETDEEYVAFLRNYYEKVFGKEKNKNKFVIVDGPKDMPLPPPTHGENVTVPVLPSGEEVSHQPPTVPEEVITLYRDLNDDNQVYTPESVLRGFGIEPHSEPTMVDGVPCYRISRDTDQIINSFAKMSRNPKMRVEYIDTYVKEIVKEKPPIDEILDKLSKRVDSYAESKEEFTATNLQISKDFKEELKSGDYAYNIVHIVPATLRASISLFRKLIHRLFKCDRSRDEMEALFKALDELSDDELNALIDAYESGELDADKNRPVNPIIVERLSQYAKRRSSASDLSEMIDDYAQEQNGDEEDIKAATK